MNNDELKAMFRNILVIRSNVVGLDDYTMRFPKWVERITKGGIVDCPAKNPMQYIDARDQATFVVDMMDRQVTSIYDYCLYPHTTLTDMLDYMVTTVGGL